MDTHMSDGFSGSAGIAIFKLYGAKAVFGMIGAALLYVVLPPTNKDGSYNRTEFVLRLAAAGVFSIVFGDMVADAINNTSWLAPWIQPYKHKSAIDLMVGAPGWWVSRAVALAMRKREGKDIVELGKEMKEIL
jgi:hypothetical protein